MYRIIDNYLLTLVGDSFDRNSLTDLSGHNLTWALLLLLLTILWMSPAQTIRQQNSLQDLSLPSALLVLSSATITVVIASLSVSTTAVSVVSHWTLVLVTCPLNWVTNFFGTLNCFTFFFFCCCTLGNLNKEGVMPKACFFSLSYKVSLFHRKDVLLSHKLSLFHKKDVSLSHSLGVFHQM